MRIIHEYFFEHGKNERNEIAPCGACGLSRKLFAKAHQAKASSDDDQKNIFQTQRHRDFVLTTDCTD